MFPDAVFIHPTAEIATSSRIGIGTRIWHQAQVMADAVIGADCTLGKGVFVGAGSRIGNLVKLGNYANVFGATLEDEVFLAPMVCILEDRTPRATNLDGTRKLQVDFQSAPALVQRGASVGAGSLILPGVVIGRFAMISAGSVVHKNVPDFALMAGNPARQIGYVCQCGLKLDERLQCECGRGYRLAGEVLEWVSAG